MDASYEWLVTIDRIFMMRSYVERWTLCQDCMRVALVHLSMDIRGCGEEELRHLASSNDAYLRR